MKRIIIDMDEVIADPMGSTIQWYQSNYANTIDYEKMLVGSWVKGFPDEHQSMIRQRIEAPGFFRHLPVMEDSVEVLKALNNKYELFIVSAAMEFPNSLKDKWDWLQDHFPFIGWKQVAFCGDKKLISGDIMIDDHTKNLKDFKGKPYIYTSPHNLNVTGYDRINNWKEAAALFL